MLATNIYDLATKFFPLVASCLLSKKVNFEPWDVLLTMNQMIILMNDDDCMFLRDQFINPQVLGRVRDYSCTMHIYIHVMNCNSWLHHRRKPCNAVTQYVPRTLGEKSKEEKRKSTTDVLSFIDKVTPR